MVCLGGEVGVNLGGGGVSGGKQGPDAGPAKCQRASHAPRLLHLH